MKNCKLKLLLPLFCLMAGTLFAQTQEIKDLVNEGIKYHDEGNYDQAIATYQKALAIDPTSTTALYELSYSYFANGDYENARLYSKKVLDYEADHMSSAYVIYGSALDMLGHSKDALKVYEQGMADYDDYMLQYNYAITCRKLGEMDKAYEAVVKGIQQNPQHSSSHKLLSELMQKKGMRIQAMLPLYYFLLLEPYSDRSPGEYKALLELMEQGVTQTDGKSVNIEIPTNGNTDFTTAEMMLSMSMASKNLEENKNKTKMELFAETNERLFKTLGELQKDQTGIWWDLYVPFFSGLAKDGYTATFSNYISVASNDEALAWIDAHGEALEAFANWVNGN